jgi:hypothetical protein
MNPTDCPSCGIKIDIKKRIHLGDYLRCPWCSSIFEVIALAPIELDWPIDPPATTSFPSKRFVY